MLSQTTGFQLYKQYRSLLMDFPWLCEHSETNVFKEELLQIIWNEQLLKAPLQTNLKSTIQVIHPGTWNQEAGPDFLDAQLKIVTPEGVEAEISGHIEIHTTPDLWYAHGHHQDQRYNHVILHVVWKDHHKVAPEIPIVELSTHIDRPLPHLLDQLPLNHYSISDRYPPEDAAFTLLEKTDDQIRKLFENIAVARFKEKSTAIQKRVTLYGSEQALYLSIAEALGFKYNRNQFMTLCETVPIKKLSQQTSITAKQAILLGAGGFLPDPTTAPVLEELNAKLKELWPIWWPHRSENTQHIEWDMRGRPQNSPFRRIVALSYLIDKMNCAPAQYLSNLAKSAQSAEELVNTLEEAFSHLNCQEWKNKLNFSRKMKISSELIGKERRQEIICNVILPFLSSLSTFKENYLPLKAFITMPAIASNKLIKEGSLRFLLPPSRSKNILKTNGAQQGLIQLLKDLKHFGKEKVMRILNKL